jgi:hypothetical protein
MIALVDGIVASINQAHDSIQPGNVFLNQGLCVSAVCLLMLVGVSGSMSIRDSNIF